MADTKISAMTSAASVLNADQVPIVSAGANFRASRSALLTAGVGEIITIQGVAGQHARLRNSSGFGVIGVDSGSNAYVHGANGAFVGWPSGTVGFSVDGLGNLRADTQTWADFTIAEPGGAYSMACSAPGQTIVFQCANGMTCPYVDGSGGSWTPAAPTHYNAAIDRLAVAVRGILGVGPPL